MVLDFNTPIDFSTYVNQIENFIKNKELLRQVSFDIYDFNNDSKISEIDLFKLFQFFDKTGQDTFEKAFQKDLMAIIKHLQTKRLALHSL